MPLLNQVDSLPPLKQKLREWAATLKPLWIQNAARTSPVYFFVTRLAGLDLHVQMKAQRASHMGRVCSTATSSLFSVIFCYRIFLVLTLQFLPVLLGMRWTCEQKTNKDWDMKLLFHFCAKVLSCSPFFWSRWISRRRENKPHTTKAMLKKPQKTNFKWSLRLSLHQLHS